MTDGLKLPEPADKIIADFVAKISSIKPKFVHGIYLTGSLSMNDFYSNKSDIDFLVLCTKLPDLKTATQLAHIHKIIRKHYSQPDLSGTYLDFNSLQTKQTEEIKSLTYHKGAMQYGILDMALVVLSELKMNAITVLGQRSETLPIDINKSDLNSFLHKNLNSYWTRWIHKYSSSFYCQLLLLFFPRLTEWSVLGVARQLCTLQTGKIVSKTEAGIYCLQQLPDQFHSILNEAIKIRKSNRSYPFIKSYTVRLSLKRFTQTIACVKYIISEFNKTYNDNRQHITCQL